MEHDDLEHRLKLIADTAPGLRAAGVASVEITKSVVSIKYAPPYGPLDSPTAPDAKPADGPAPEPEPDPLDDPDTYGGEVPGFDLEEPA